MAVRHGYGKIAGADALVFAYDTGDTRNSYKGEPTTNLTTDTPSQGGWDGTYEVLNSSTKAFRFIISNFAANPGAGWRSFTWDLRAYTGQSVTISATVEVPTASPGTFAWIMMGQGNTYTNNSGAGGYLGYSAASERVYKSSTVQEHITWSGIIGNSGTANQPSGHIGFTVWYNNGTPGINSYVEVSNVQIEIKSHATPFVNGTRSSTQGLLDLTGNSTIDLANVSFDSNAQMTFDGTSDVTYSGNLPQLDTFSLEVVLKPSALSGWFLYRNTNMNYTDNSDNFIFGFSANKLSGGVEYHPTGDDRSVISTTVLNTGEYVHGVLVHDNSTLTLRIYVNGNLEGTTVSTGQSYPYRSTNKMSIGADGGSNHGGISGNKYYYSGDINVVKVYNRALTAAEVRNNYNQYKGRFNI